MPLGLEGGPEREVAEVAARSLCVCQSPCGPTIAESRHKAALITLIYSI